MRKSARDRMEGIPVTNIYYGLSWFAVISALLLLFIGLLNASLALSEKGVYGMAYALSLFAAIGVLDFVASQRLNAAGCGITKFIDLLHYCEFAMDHAEDFHQRVEWQVVWERMRSSKASLSTVARESGIGEET